MRSGTVLFVACLIGSHASPSSGDELTRARVDRWQVPAECIQAAELESFVEKNMQAEVASERRVVTGRADRTARGYRFQLDVWEDGVHLGEREFDVEGDDCRRDDESIGLVATMLLEGPDPRDAPAPKPAPKPPARPAPPPARSEFVPALGVAFGAASDLAPGFAPAILGSLVLDLPFRLSTRAVGGYGFPTRASDAEVGALEIESLVLGGELCFAPLRVDAGSGAAFAGFRFDLCGGARALRLAAFGRDFPENRAGATFLGGGTLLGRLRIPLLGRLRAVGGGGVLVAWNQARFVGVTANGDDVILHRTTRVAPLLEIGVELAFD